MPVHGPGSAVLLEGTGLQICPRSSDIDLGTTNSVVAVMEGRRAASVLINSTGNRTTPSVVAFTDKGERLVGHQQVTNPKNTSSRSSGSWAAATTRCTRRREDRPLRGRRRPDELVKVKVRDKTYTPQEISAMILQELKKTAEDYLGETVERAVITVPAYFNDSQRTATKEAGEIAGLKVERIINEPTAAALAYGLEKKKNAKIAVFDLGGGTFDISILDIGDGVFEVLSTNGDTHLGGDDFDQRLIDFIAEEFRKKEGIDIRRRRDGAAAAQGGVREGQVRAVAADRDDDQPAVHHRRPERSQAPAGDDHPREVRVAGRGQLFDRLPRSRARRRSRTPSSRPATSTDVVMVGGSTRIPKVQEIAKEIFETGELDKSINPDEVVAVGAAIQGGVLQGDVKDVLLLDVTPLSLGVETLGGVMTALIEKNTTIPDEQEGDLLHRGGQPDVGDDPRPPGRARVRQGQPDAGPIRSHRHSARAARHAADRGRVRDRCERHSERLGHRQGDRQEPEHQDHGIVRSGARDEIEEHEAVEAEQHASDDKRATRARRRSRTRASRSPIYATRQSLEEHGDKVSSPRRAAASSRRLSNLEDEGQPATTSAAIEAALKQLNEASIELGKAVYESAAEAPTRKPGGGASDEATGGDDDVIDAEYEVKDDE